MCDNSDLLISSVNKLVSVLPDVIYKIRRNVKSEVLKLKAADEESLFKQLASIVKTECMNTLQADNYERKKKKKKSIFIFFRRKSNKKNIDKETDNFLTCKLNIFDVLIALCLHDISELPSKTNIDKFVDEALLFIINKCVKELSQFIEGNLYSIPKHLINDKKQCSTFSRNEKQDTGVARKVNFGEKNIKTYLQKSTEEKKKLKNDLEQIVSIQYNFIAVGAPIVANKFGFKNSGPC